MSDEERDFPVRGSVYQKRSVAWRAEFRRKARGGIEELIPQIFVGEAMKCVGTAFGTDGNGCSGAAAVFRGVRIGDDVEFLNGVDRRVRSFRAELLNVFRDGVVVDSVEHEIVLQRVNAMNVESHERGRRWSRRSVGCSD